MSNRVRVLLNQPDYGPAINGAALRTVETQFAARQNVRSQKHQPPELFLEWPRWKRCSWMAKKLGPTWKLQVFRESRRVKARNSLFWKAVQHFGFQMPNRHKNVKVAKPRINGAHVDARYIDDLLNAAAQGVDPVAAAIPAGGIREENAARWQNIWAVDPIAPLPPQARPPVAEAPAPGPRGPHADPLRAGRQYVVNYGHQRAQVGPAGNRVRVVDARPRRNER